MRLVFVMNTLGIGGAENNLLDFLEAVDGREFECAVVTLERAGWINARLAASGALSRVLGGSYASKTWHLNQFLRRWRPDIVQLHGLRADLLGRALGRLHGCAVVSAIQGANPGRPWHQVLLDRATARLVDRWIANSEAGKLLAVRTIGVPPSKITVVHNGIDPEHFAPTADRDAIKQRLGISPSTKVVLTVANLRPMKGHTTIVRAIPGILERAGDAIFLFVGADLIGGRVQADARDHGVDHHIRFLGLHDDVRPFLAVADVFVLPSTHEGLPTSIMEAMAMQLPVVASRVGGIPELVVPNETGLLIQPGDVRCLEDAVVQLLLAPLLRDRFGANARRRVLEHFSLDRMVAALKSEYTSLAQLR